MGTRIVEIEHCGDCPYMDFDGDSEEKWGKMWCDTLDRLLPTTNIPEDCPLPTNKDYLKVQ